MKKKLLSIITILMFFVMTLEVDAKSYDVSLNGDSSFNDEVKITLQIKNQKDMDGICEGICGLMATLKYDSSKLELIELDELNDYEATYNEKDGSIVIEKDAGNIDDIEVLVFTFKNKSLKNGDTTAISLANISGTDGDSDILTRDISKNIKYVKKEVNDSSSKEEKDDIESNNVFKKSNNNYLSSISIDSENIEFSKDKFEYEVVVLNATDKITITGDSEDSKAVVSGFGEYKLDVGNNTIKLIVKAEDGSEREYIIKVNRKSEEVVDEEITEDIPEDVEIVEKENNTYLYIVLGISLIFILGIIFFIRNRNK